MVFGHTKQYKYFGQIPIRRAKFPKCPTNCIDATSRHIHRTEAAMRGKIWRAILLRPPASQRLRLVTASEKCQLFWIGLADWRQPVGRRLQGLFPADRLKLATATRPNTPQWAAQSGW